MFSMFRKKVEPQPDDGLDDLFKAHFKEVFEKPESSEWERMMGFWYQRDMQRGYALRHAQVFIVCLRHACTSKNRSTSAANYEAATGYWIQGVADHEPPLPILLSKFLSDELINHLDKSIRRILEEYPWRSRSHFAEGLVEKAAKLKTARGRSKYLLEARAELEIVERYEDHDKPHLQDIRSRIAALECTNN